MYVPPGLWPPFLQTCGEPPVQPMYTPPVFLHIRGRPPVQPMYAPLGLCPLFVGARGKPLQAPYAPPEHFLPAPQVYSDVREEHAPISQAGSVANEVVQPKRRCPNEEVTEGGTLLTYLEVCFDHADHLQFCLKHVCNGP